MGESGAIAEVRHLHATARPSMLRVGTHLVDAMLWLGGESRESWVLGHAHGRLAYGEDHPCPDHVSGVVELTSAVRGILEIGTLAPRNLPDSEFWGDVAVTAWGSEGHARVVLGGGWKAMTRQSLGRVESGPPHTSPSPHDHPRHLTAWLDHHDRVHPSHLPPAY